MTPTVSDAIEWATFPSGTVRGVPYVFGFGQPASAGTHAARQIHRIEGRSCRGRAAMHVACRERIHTMQGAAPAPFRRPFAKSRLRSRVVAAFTVTIALTGCRGEPDSGAWCSASAADAAAPPAQEITYYRDVKPIMDGKCAPCHREGGIGPFPLTSYDEVLRKLDRVAYAVRTRKMPPWLAARC